jgi:hypothetical protein
VNFALQAIRSLKACWQLVCLDEDGYDQLDLSADGFWDSFKAIFLVAPLYIYANSAGAQLTEPPQAPPAIFAAISMLALLWVTWPWLMISISHLLGVERNYVRYVVAYNWTSVYIIAALVPVLLLQQLGVLGQVSGALVSLCVVAWSLFLRYYVARTGLKTGALASGGLVAADLLLSFMLSALV